MSRRLLDGKRPVPPPGADPGGRPSTLEINPEIVDKIVGALRIASPIETAFISAGIPPTTMKAWLHKGLNDPDSVYGALRATILKAVADWEVSDLVNLHKHAVGAPAEYEMEVVRDRHGDVVFDSKGDPVRQVAKDGEGRPIVRREAIKADWRVSLERLSRRKPRVWARHDTLDIDTVMAVDQKQTSAKDVTPLHELVAAAVRKLEEDV